MITVLPWASGLCCALLALSGCIRMARAAGGWRDPGCWHAPLILTSAALALLAWAGALPVLAGAFLALVPLAVVALVVRPAWQSAAGKLGRGAATRIVLRGLAGRLRDALQGAWQDLRVLAGRPPECAPEAAAPAVADRPRRTPSTALPHPDLGPAPVPAQVAADLTATGVAVPGAWAAVAERFAAFEPEDGEDLRLFVAENAAGILVVAEAIGCQAEDLAAGLKLDPAFTEAQVAFADDFADTASAAAMTLRAYDNAYDGVHEHVDNGGTLPEDSRSWFGAGGTEGQAA
jgi:hypothetical protein